MADVTMWTGRIDFPADYAALKKLSAGRTEVARPVMELDDRSYLIGFFKFPGSLCFLNVFNVNYELQLQLKKNWKLVGLASCIFSPWTNIISI